jgi:hypothetical protein
VDEEDIQQNYQEDDNEYSNFVPHYGNRMAISFGRLALYRKVKRLYHQHNSWGGVGVGAPVALGSFASTEINRIGTLDRKAHHQGDIWDEWS